MSMTKRNIHNIFATSLLVLLAATSCVTPRRVNYLQDMCHGSQIELENKFEATIAPYDELSIYVSCFDQKLAQPYNLGNNNTFNTANSTNYGPGYLVDVNGNIQFPVLGQLHVEGLTRLQLQDTIAQRLKDGNHLSDPYVMVRFKNFKIFFLGADGGKAITISNERCTFLEALALSGDLSVYTNRAEIAVMREVNGVMTMRYLDPRSSKIFNDPYFMLQQNDFIITNSNNLSTTRNEISYWIGWVSTAVSLSSLLVSVLIYNSLKK